MSDTRKWTTGSSRRKFLEAAAGVTAGTVLGRRPLAAQSGRAGEAAAARSDPTLSRIDPAVHDHARSGVGLEPVQSPGRSHLRRQHRAGSALHDFLVSKMQEFGAVDLDYVEIPYDHYIVDDWPDRRTHIHDSGVAVEKLVTDGTPVPVVASYGMTSGFTPPEGVTAPMLYYDPAHPPAAGRHRGQDSRLPDRALPRSAVLQFVPGQLHAHRLRMAFAGQMAAAVHAAAGERHQLLSFPLGLEPAQRLCRDRHQRTRRRHRHRLRPVAGGRVRAGAAQRLHAGRQGGTRRDVRQLSHAHARSRQRGEGAGGCQGRKDGHSDPHRPLPARHRQGHHRLFARQELRHRRGRAGPARHPHRRHVLDRREWRPGHARHHVLFQSPAAVGAAAHAGVLLRLPAFHAGRRGAAGRNSTITRCIPSG